MHVPIMTGVIVRRLLVNYRVAPDVLARQLPPPFRPLRVGGWGIAGICLIGLRSVRPHGFPAAIGLASENAAHRIAVEWDDASGTRSGVYVPRRDTNSRINAVVGGRLFPGVHHRARFEVSDTAERVAVTLESNDGRTRVSVAARVAIALPTDSVFGSLAAASAFFEGGALGYSAGRQVGQFDGLELRTTRWQAVPLAVERVASTFFNDTHAFPLGSAVLDCALLMRDVEHEWHARGPLSSDMAARAD